MKIETMEPTVYALNVREGYTGLNIGGILLDVPPLMILQQGLIIPKSWHSNFAARTRVDVEVVARVPCWYLNNNHVVQLIRCPKAYRPAFGSEVECWFPLFLALPN